MTKIIGHRGAAGLALENTISSFKKAVNLKADMIEIDVQRTADNQLIVFHDNVLDRITNKKGFVKDLNTASLSKVTLKNKSKILLLDDACKFCRDNRIELFIELKSEGIATEVFNTASKYLRPEKLIIGSFHHHEIANLIRSKLNVKTCIIFESYPVNLLNYVLAINSDFVSVGFEAVTDEMIKELKKTRKKILLWTIDTKTEMSKALSYKPFGIITNYPNSLPAK
jgi:glycerophosphoryl diester phosphodiesterase